MDLGGSLNREYDLIDLWFDYHDKLPSELTRLALEMLLKNPSRLVTTRKKVVVDAAIDLWAWRMPRQVEVEALAALLDPGSVPMPLKVETWKPTVEDIAQDQPLVYFITHFTKVARPSPHFSSAFKLIHGIIMPHVVRLFPTAKNST